MTDYTVLDLFAGLGGFSSAFEDSERWNVTAVEIEEKFDPDMVADVFTLRPSDFERDYDVVLASPPCTVFSTAGNHDQWDHQAKEPTGEKAQEFVALTYHALGLVKGLNPEYWYVENPRGRMRWILGQPAGTVTYCQYGRDYMKPTDLWGDHPPMEYRNCGRQKDCHVSNLDHDGTSAVASMNTDHAKRSLVPYQLSEQIRDACERALDGESVRDTTVMEWC